MRLKFVSAILMFAVLGTLVGCGGGSTSTTNNPPPPPPPAPTLQSLAITPYAPAVTLGTPLQLTLTGTYSDGSQKDVTSSGSWSSDTTGVATVSANGGLVTGVAAGVATIKVNIGSVGASTPLDVTNLALSNATLSGNYAFLVSGVGSGNPAFLVGTFNADGKGNITGGTADLVSPGGANNGSVGAANNAYSVTADGRGTATLTIMGNKITVAFIISQDGSRGKMISFDKNISSGIFEKQDGTPSLSGKFVYRLNGQSFSGQTGTNTATVGLIDIGAPNGSIRDVELGSKATSSDEAFTANLNAATNSRGTATLGANNYAYYIVNASRAYLVQTDANQVVAGIADQQQASPFTTPTGPYTFLLEHGASAQHGTFERAGEMDLTNPVAITGTEETDDSSNPTQTISGTTSASVDPTTGRGSISYTVPTGAGCGPCVHTAAIYVVSSDHFAMMDRTSTSFPGTGVARQVSGAAIASGNFAFSLSEIGEQNLMTLGEMIISTSGNSASMTGIAYNNNNGTTAVTLVSASASATGRSENPATNLETKNLVIYVIGTGEAVAVGQDPDTDGTFDQQ